MLRRPVFEPAPVLSYLHVKQRTQAEHVPGSDALFEHVFWIL
jgi:hypothetical protein